MLEDGTIFERCLAAWRKQTATLTGCRSDVAKNFAQRSIAAIVPLFVCVAQVRFNRNSVVTSSPLAVYDPGDDAHGCRSDDKAAPESGCVWLCDQPDALRGGIARGANGLYDGIESRVHFNPQFAQFGAQRAHVLCENIQRLALGNLRALHERHFVG
jgi:hypothetical protein